MPNQWYYSRDGAVHGPFSEAQMKEAAALKILREHDVVWQKGREAEGSDIAKEVFDFGSSAASLPDWLADVASAPAEVWQPRIAEPMPTHEDPDWLEDLRLWVGLEIFAGVKKPAEPSVEIAPSAPGKVVGLPDWLENWTSPEKASASPPPAAPKSAPIPPVAKSSPPVVAERAQTPAEKMREESGFDADTGQILDPVKFRQWQKQQAHATASAQPAVSNGSMFEVFRRGRLAIETWVDEEKNRLCILHAELDEIRKDAKIQAIIQDAAKYGKEFQDKLGHHLVFMVENRRKYYKAVAERAG